MSSEIIAAILGALLAGGLQTLVGIRDRRLEQSAILNAITSEVSIICELIRFRGYVPFLADVIEQMESNPGVIKNPNADFSSNYFSVFESLSSSLGKIKPDQARAVVRFYATCKACVESLRPDGSSRQIQDASVVLAHHKQLHQLLQRILILGDEIVQFADQRQSNAAQS